MWEDGGGIAEALFLCLDSGKGKCTDEEKEEENGVCIVVRVVGLVWFGLVWLFEISVLVGWLKFFVCSSLVPTPNFHIPTSLSL